MSDTVVVASTTNSMDEIKAAAESGVTVDTSKPEPTAAPETPATEPATEPAAEAETPEGAAEQEAASGEPAPEPEPATEPEKKVIRERKRDLQGRIDELVRDKYTSQRAATEAQNEVLRLRAELENVSRRVQPQEQPQPQAEAPKVVDDPEPTSDDFNTFEEFTKATAKWAARVERRALEREAAESRRQWEAQEQERRRVWHDQQTRQSND